MWDDIFRTVGIHRTPVAYRGEAGLPWRAARKIVRMTILRALLAMAPLVGGGESIHAIFRKEDSALLAVIRRETTGQPADTGLRNRKPCSIRNTTGRLRTH